MIAKILNIQGPPSKSSSSWTRPSHSETSRQPTCLALPTHHSRWSNLRNLVWKYANSTSTYRFCSRFLFLFLHRPSSFRLWPLVRIVRSDWAIIVLCCRSHNSLKEGDFLFYFDLILNLDWFWSYESQPALREVVFNHCPQRRQSWGGQLGIHEYNPSSCWYGCFDLSLSINSPTIWAVLRKS